MWLGLLFDTIETRQAEGDAFLVEGVAFCIAVVAFFRGVMHLGRSVFHFGVRVMQWGESGGVLHLLSTRWGRASVASGVHEMGTLVHLVSMISCSRPSRRGCR